MIVTGGNNAGDFLRLLGNGSGVRPQALELHVPARRGRHRGGTVAREHFAEGEKVCVILGDNIIERNIQRAAAAFRSQERGAKILLKRVPDPERFGVAVLAASASSGSSKSRAGRRVATR